MKECELCELGARMYCESDQASLCWDCDAKVHGANFLVARHSRSLLCQICQSVTAWRASGARPGPTVTVCEKCVARNCSNGGGGEEEDDENQVVPLASVASGPPASFSSDEEHQAESSEQQCVESLNRQAGWGSNPALDASCYGKSAKRQRETADGGYEGDPGCSCSGANNNWASPQNAVEDDATSPGPRRSKERKREDDDDNALVDTLERIRREDSLIGTSSNSTVLAICKLCNASRAVQDVSLNSEESPNDGCM